MWESEIHIPMGGGLICWLGVKMLSSHLSQVTKAASRTWMSQVQFSALPFFCVPDRLYTRCFNTGFCLSYHVVIIWFNIGQWNRNLTESWRDLTWMQRATGLLTNMQSNSWYFEEYSGLEQKCFVYLSSKYCHFDTFQRDIWVFSNSTIIFSRNLNKIMTANI